jgi:hypothetical protein
MNSDIYQVLILLILINLAFCSYYYLLYKDGVEKKNEDYYLLKLDEQFSNTGITNENMDIATSNQNKKELPNVCHGFHDNFFNNNKYLGWRFFYLKNQNFNKVEEPDNFQGVLTRNYLDNLENVKNEITVREQQIRL